MSQQATLITEVDQLERRLRRRERKSARNYKFIIEKVNELSPQKVDYWLDRKRILLDNIDQEEKKIKKQKELMEIIKKA